MTNKQREEVLQYLRVHTEIEHKTISKQDMILTTMQKNFRNHWYDDLPSTLYQYYLVFDTETTTDATQALRFGTFELHGLSQTTLYELERYKGHIPITACDTLIMRGLFFSDTLAESDIAIIKNYAASHGLVCLTQVEFTKLFYYYCHNEKLYTLLIGHNLAFDITRLARQTSYAKKQFINGFSLKLCSCTWERSKTKHYNGDSCQYHPNIRFKKLGSNMHLYEFVDRKPRGNFLDTVTFARALLGPGSLSLNALGHVLDISDKKLVGDIVHGTGLTERYLDYAIQDVIATWGIFQKLRDIYATYHFNKKMSFIVSEASLGKALYKELGISPPLQRMNSLNTSLHGYAMSAYYGGRSEVHIRKTPIEVIYCDFKSEYPTVFHLLKLQDMLLAESYREHDVTESIKALLRDFTLDKLQDREYWSKLRVLCKISGDNLLLPVRAKFNGLSTNIALCNVSLPSTWYTLADILANLLLGGSLPHIERAIEVLPVGQIRTNSITLFNGLITINPERDDIFITLINERTRIKQLAKQHTKDKERLLRVQQALKLLANSTSYGINIELRLEESEEPITLYCNDTPLQAASPTRQIPGNYYCPLIGTHIPACGRLLLAIAQRLGCDRGLSYAFCDTDSMAFTKSASMSRSAFHSHVTEIRDWFKPLYPYNDDGELFELEEVNQWCSEMEPLYCLAISAKRYALYNKKADGGYRLRKVSAHGLGAYSVSDTYTSPPHIPPLEIALEKIGLSPHQQWIHDLWYIHVALVEEDIFLGRALPYIPALSTPVYHQVTIATANIYKQFGHIPHIKPCNFVTVFPAFTSVQLKARVQDYPDNQVEYQRIRSAMYVPFTRDVHALTSFYVLQSNECVHDIQPVTIQEALQDYFNHPEHKSANGRLLGEMVMRHVKIMGYLPQGKESSYEVIELEDNALPEYLSSTSINHEYMSFEKWERLQHQIRDFGVNALARALDTNNAAISRMVAKRVPPDKHLLARIQKSIK